MFNCYLIIEACSRNFLKIQTKMDWPILAFIRPDNDLLEFILITFFRSIIKEKSLSTLGLVFFEKSKITTAALFRINDECIRESR